MVKRNSKMSDVLSPETMIEVVAVSKGKKSIKKEMTIDQANRIPMKKGWNYIRYQLGFSQY
jgi:hypothetical protein|tara:strand:- start:36364 stop:36546 length:183 start_codon:yes stop_codon:yes gene_type:complete